MRVRPVPAPADLAFSAVRVYDADGVLLRVISTDQLQAIGTARLRTRDEKAPTLERHAMAALYPLVRPSRKEDLQKKRERKRRAAA